MLNQQPEGTAQPLALLLELTADETEESDPALIHTIGRDTIEALQDDNITVQPVYTGKQGGEEFLVEIVTTFGQLATTVWDHKAIVEEVINDSSALATLATFIFTVVRHVKHSYEERVGLAESVARPIKSTLELDGSSIPLETANSAQVQATILKLVERHQATHARIHTFSPKKLKIQHKIPRKRPGGKRTRGKK